MYVVIIGLGQVGRHLVRVLEADGHDIVAVDKSADAVRYVSEHHDVMTLVGYGAGESVLEKAGVAKADLVVAVSDNDEANLIAALAARNLGATRAIARVQGDEWAKDAAGVRYGLLGVDVVINPSVLVAHELFKIARSHGAVEVIEFQEHRVELVQVELCNGMAGCSLRELSLPDGTLVAAIVRGEKLFVPTGDDVFERGDRVYLIGSSKELLQAEDLFSSKREANRACIIGGGVTGLSLAKELSEAGTQVLLIESGKARAYELSAALPKATVLHGDGTDSRLLREEDIGAYDLVAAVTNDDELNLMAALLVQKMGATTTAAVVERPDYVSIYKQLGIDIVVSPRAVASDHILRYSRGREIASLTSLQDGQAEVLELSVQKEAAVVNVPLKDVNIPRGALIAAVVHNNQVTVPRGKDVIRAGDRVIVMATAEVKETVARLFGTRIR